MSEIPKVKGRELSIGQRVAWPVYTKNDSGEPVMDKFLANRVKKVDDEYVYFENDKKRQIASRFIILKSNTTQTYYDKNEKDLLRDLKKAEPADDDETELSSVEKAPTPLLNETEYLDKYTKQIKGTLENFDKLSKKLQNDEEQVNSKIYNVAKILSAAREEAKNEATQQNDEKLEKKLFAKLKKQVVEKFNASSRRNLNKAIKVASDPRIQQYQSRLPVAHTVLYSLTSLSNPEFDTLMDDKNVTPNKTREDLLKIVREIKGKKPQPKKYIITRISETEESEKDIEDLKKDLESKGWDIKDFATKTQKSKT